MAEDLSKVRIGRRRVFFKGIDMGHTLDGAVLNIDRSFKEVNVDKYGTTPVDLALTGNGAKITVKLAQEEFNTWRAAVPESSEQDGSAGDRVDFGADAGKLLRADAGELWLHKPDKALSDRSEDYVFYKAVSSEPVEVPFKVDEQTVLEITFTCLVDETYNDGRRLGHYGPADVS
jgi:hypothetical protein